MTEYSSRLLATDAEIRHLAACLYPIAELPDVGVDAEIAGIISRLNESVGGVNDDTQGSTRSPRPMSRACGVS